MQGIILICCRAGSKRLPNKNILPFANSNLTTIACEQGVRVCQKLSPLGIDAETVISTDLDIDLPELVNYVPRPRELATDTAQMQDVVAHAVNTISSTREIDFVCLIQPTSPIRRDKDIVAAVTLLKHNPGVTVLSVSKPLQPMTDFISLDGKLANLDPQGEFTQHLFITGGIYCLSTSALHEHKSIVGEPDRIKLLVTPPETGLDIDHKFQFDLAREIYSVEYAET